MSAPQGLEIGKNEETDEVRSIYDKPTKLNIIKIYLMAIMRNGNHPDLILCHVQL